MRKFKHLPADPPMFHGSPSEGGLGIPEMETVICQQLNTLRDNLRREGGIWNGVSKEFCDGRGLALSTKRSGYHPWISDGASLMKGAEYVEAIKIRFYVIGTKEHNNRKDTSHFAISCDLGCPRVSILRHILQECPVTALLRTARHDRVAEILRTALSSRNWWTWSEPTIPTFAGLGGLTWWRPKGPGRSR